MATASFSPPDPFYDILDVGTGLLFLINNTLPTLTNTGNAVEISYTGSESPSFSGLSVRATGNFTSSSTLDWQVTSLDFRVDQASVLRVTGLSLTGADLLDTDNRTEILEVILGGDDTIIYDSDFQSTAGEGFAGDDLIILRGHQHEVYGSAGNDTVRVASDSSETTFLTTSSILYSPGGNNFLRLNTNETFHLLNQVEFIEFTDKTATASIGSDEGDLLLGDTYTAVTSSDVIAAGDGDDHVSGFSGLDTLLGEDGLDTLLGGNGADSLAGGNGNDELNGGNGNDTLLGDEGDDLLKGGNGGDRVLGGNGNDTVNGGAHADTLSGGSGVDILSGGKGADSILGGAQNDQLSGGDGRDTLKGGAGDDRLFGGEGNDVLFAGAKNDLLNGGKGNDSLNGASGADTLVGNIGDDTLNGGNGRDSLTGGQGNDSLNGDAHRDTLFGGTGENTLTGGGGVDEFLFTDNESINTITDFRNGIDHIRINNGADTLADLTIVDLDGDSLITFGETTIIVTDIDAATLNDSDNFLF